jgi:polysaccharide biosynthesis protein PslG
MMRGKYNNVGKKLKTTKKQWILVAIIASFFLLGIAIKQIFYPTVYSVFHGPHLSQALYKSGLNEKDILGSKTNRITDRFRRNPTPTPTKKNILSPTPSIKITSIPTPTPTYIPIVTIKHNSFGIAAGNDLPSNNQSDLNIYFSQLKTLGISWVRWDFDWGFIQKDGLLSFNWAESDLTVQTAIKYGINTLGVITYTPTWAQLSECKGTFACAPSDPNAFGLFAGQVAARYAPMGVHTWEIWNEPNIPLFWKPAPNVRSYVNILKSAYTNIKKSDASAFILTAGLSPASDNENRINPITFIQNTYDLDGGLHFDGISLHPYSYPVVASYPAAWNTWQKISIIRSMMDTHGDSQKPIWFTEYGAPTGGSGTDHSTTQLDFTFGNDYMTEDAQSVMMQDSLSQYEQISSPVGPFFWYSMKDRGTDRSTPENFFGLMRYDWSKKPAYDVLHNAIVANQ